MMQKITAEKLAISMTIVAVVLVFASCSKQQSVPQDNQQNDDQDNNQTQNEGDNNQQQIADSGQDNQQQNDGQQDVNPYEGWQVYRNEEWGIEFKYPSSLYVRNCQYLVGFSKKSEDITECGEGNETLTPINVVATIYDIGDGPNELLQRHINFYDEALTQKTKKVTKLDGIQATEFSGIWKRRDDIMRKEVIGTKIKIILFAKEEYMFSVALDYYNSNEVAISDYETVFYDIISTFKFQK